jgi:hypothetical protein
MANAYFTFPALLVIYAAQRAAELRARLIRPRFGLLHLPKQVGALRAATNPA